MSDWRHWHRRLFLAGAALLFLSLEAWARAGDGQRFSGGGGGWSSGTTIGGDGSSGVDIAYLIYLVVRYPAIGVPVLIVVLIVGYLKYQGQHRIETTIRNHNLQRHHAQRDANLAALQERDTTFELNAFKRRVQDGFERIQRAWAGGNIESVRPCMSDGVYERFNVQLELLRAAHQRNHMSGVQVDDVDVVAVTSDGQFDALHVAIRATAIDYTVDTHNDRLIHGNKRTPHSFIEYWSFLRKPGAKTRDTPGLLEGNCPNCGGAIKAVDAATCTFCGSVLNAGEYDWVLTEITQEVVWDVDRAVADLPGVSELRSRDADFNTQHVEDRASATFWRLIAAETTGNQKKLGRCASESFVAAKQHGMKTDNQGRDTWLSGVAIGAVEIQTVRREGAFDFAEVMVHWSASRENHPAAPTRSYRHTLVLKRSAEAQSVKHNLLASCHCPGCGAPDTASKNPTCDFCGTPLNTGRYSWVLDSIHNRLHSRHQRHVVSSVPREYTGRATLADKEVIACAITVMYADGHVDDREEMQLNRFARTRGIPPSELADIIDSVNKGDGASMAADSPESARELIDTMLAMCLADGHVDRAERQMLKNMGAKANLTDYDIDQLVKRKRAELYREARGAA